MDGIKVVVVAKDGVVQQVACNIPGVEIYVLDNDVMGVDHFAIDAGGEPVMVECLDAEVDDFLVQNAMDCDAMLNKPTIFPIGEALAAVVGQQLDITREERAEIELELELLADEVASAHEAGTQRGVFPPSLFSYIDSRISGERMWDKLKLRQTLLPSMVTIGG